MIDSRPGQGSSRGSGVDGQGVELELCGPGIEPCDFEGGSIGTPDHLDLEQFIKAAG